MSVRLTKTRLEIIIDALAYWETVNEDLSTCAGHTSAEHLRLEKERQQAFLWAHQELAKRKARKTV